MRTANQNNTRQRNLFFEPSVLPDKPAMPLFTLPKDTKAGRINHMVKFKPFHEFQKPLIGFTPESFLDYAETVIPKDHLCRLVKEVVFSLDTEALEAKYSFLGQRTYHPKLLLSVLFYGYATGVRSSRKTEEALSEMEEDEKEKINLTGRDANYMKSWGSKDIRPGYNCQAAVTESGIIVAGEAVTEANDRNQLKPVIEQTESNTQEKVKEVAADCGYGSYTNYEYPEQREIDGYVPDSNFQQYKSGEYEKEEHRYHYSNFKYDAASDSYVCPEGKRLIYWKTRTNETDSRKWNHKVYKGTECGACEKRSLCTKAKARELLYRYS